jgi:sortase A
LRIACYPLILFVCVALTFTLVLVPIGQGYAGVLGLLFTQSAPTFDSAGQAAYGTSVGTSASGIAQLEVGETPAAGQEYAILTAKAAGIDTPVYYGSTDDVLAKGIGTYTGAWLPGQGKSVVLMAHNSTFFATLPKLKAGDEVSLQTSYGSYAYQVEKSAVVNYKNAAANAAVLAAKRESLVLYTCDTTVPLGISDKRLVLYCSPVKGNPQQGANGPSNTSSAQSEGR